uniref:C2H2-type domain-containing protein n=1 Tax=viral metagenome TaxID=1070528 RepID=A0A6C0IGS0_9ZZZZ
METLGDNIKQKLSKKYCCKICDYESSRKSNIETHFKSAKHQNNIIGDTCDINKQILSNNKQKNTNLICEKCNKQYISRNGLWKHKKTCNNSNSNLIHNNESDDIFHKSNESTDKELIMLLIKENSELKNMMMKVIENGTNNVNNVNNVNNITNTNSHNKAFNLNFFLNETCKNAMNISDFVDSIKLQLSDLENVAKIGYVEGLSKIIIKNLNALDVTERPVHCSDSKRDDDKWEKENETNDKVLKAIEDIATKNSKLVKEWKQKNPECASSKSHKADVYSHIMIEAVCSNNDANNNKILKKIAKEVTIDKK